MQLKDVTPIIKAILEERDKIPRIIDKERYIPNPQPYHDGDCMRGGIRKALRIIEQAPVVDAIPRWISVEESMPEEGQIVAFIPSCNHGSVYVGVLKNIGKSGGVMFSHREGRYKSNYYAKYWMPLPPAPKEQDS